MIVEAIVEEVAPKGELLARSLEACPNADLATTTSSLSIAAIAAAAGTDKLFALHVFNPVPRMKLVEVCFPDGAAAAREKALAWCAAMGKTAVEVPDQAGFVVNRLLFPYLFEAVRLIERTGMEAGEVDTCMKLGAGHPMGPLALLDFVGLDVSQAIGDALYAENGEADPASHRECWSSWSARASWAARAAPASTPTTEPEPKGGADARRRSTAPPRGAERRQRPRRPAAAVMGARSGAPPLAAPRSGRAG